MYLKNLRRLVYNCNDTEEQCDIVHVFISKDASIVQYCFYIQNIVFSIFMDDTNIYWLLLLVEEKKSTMRKQETCYK